MEPNIQKLISPQRKKIDAIDKKLIELLAKRNDIVMLVGEIKKTYGVQIKDEKREKEIKQVRRQLAVKYGLNAKRLDEVFEAIISWSRSAQRKK